MSSSPIRTIPSTVHFLWIGRAFPLVYGLAARAAERYGGVDRVLLHHTDPIDDTPGGRLVQSASRCQLSPLRPEPLLESLGPEGPRYVDLYRRLDRPAARADLLRCALLFGEGGVYLDLDVITVKSLVPLLGAGAFCGAEHVAYPARVVHSGSRLRRGLALARSTLRTGLRRLPRGYRTFERLAWLYPPALNNAVLGAAPAHPFIAGLMRAMLDLPEERQVAPYALGPHLLQAQVERMPDAEIQVHPPHVFYPLAPEIAKHWFRLRRAADVAEVIWPETRAVHWYASTETARLVSSLTPEYILAHRERQLFSQLVAPLLN